MQVRDGPQDSDEATLVVVGEAVGSLGRNDTSWTDQARQNNRLGPLEGEATSPTDHRSGKCGRQTSSPSPLEGMVLVGRRGMDNLGFLRMTAHRPFLDDGEELETLIALIRGTRAWILQSILPVDGMDPDQIHSP